MSEAEKRLKRVCFTGYRPEKLNISEKEVKDKLREAIKQSIDDGFTTLRYAESKNIEVYNVLD